MNITYTEAATTRSTSKEHLPGYCIYKSKNYIFNNTARNSQEGVFSNEVGKGSKKQAANYQNKFLVNKIRGLMKHNNEKIKFEHPDANSIGNHRNVTSSFENYMSKGSPKGSYGNILCENKTQYPIQKNHNKPLQQRICNQFDKQTMFERSVLRSYTPHIKANEECSGSRIKKMQQNFLSRLMKEVKNQFPSNNILAPEKTLFFLNSIPNNSQLNVKQVWSSNLNNQKPSKITNYMHAIFGGKTENSAVRYPGSTRGSANRNKQGSSSRNNNTKTSMTKGCGIPSNQNKFYSSKSMKSLNEKQPLNENKCKNLNVIYSSNIRKAIEHSRNKKHQTVDNVEKSICPHGKMYLCFFCLKAKVH